MKTQWWQQLLVKLPSSTIILGTGHVQVVSFPNQPWLLLLRNLSSATLQMPPTSNESMVVVWEDVYMRNPQLVTQMLQARLGVFERVHGRKLVVDEVSRLEANDFFEANHLQGYVKSFLHLGLYDGPRCMAVAAFSKPRKFPIPNSTQKVNSYELIRIASQAGTRIAGGIDKLLQAFYELKKEGHLMTYTDREWSEGHAFKKLGFELESQTEPLEFMVNSQTFERHYVHRMKSEEMIPNGVRIQNLGNDKWVKWFSADIE